jgi:hypothetical protein
VTWRTLWATLVRVVVGCEVHCVLCVCPGEAGVRVLQLFGTWLGGPLALCVQVWVCEGLCSSWLAGRPLAARPPGFAFACSKAPPPPPPPRPLPPTPSPKLKHPRALALRATASSLLPGQAIPEVVPSAVMDVDLAFRAHVTSTVASTTKHYDDLDVG